MYQVIHPEVDYRYYYDVFHLEFANSLGFGLPKTDCCNECSEYPMLKKIAINNLDVETTTKLDAEHKAHLEVYNYYSY